MIIYTNLGKNTVIFRRLKAMCLAYDIKIQHSKLLMKNSFWFAKKYNNDVKANNILFAVQSIFNGLNLLQKARKESKKK